MTDLINSRLNEMCNYEDIQARVNKLQSIFPSWDQGYLYELAEKGCNVSPKTGIESLIDQMNSVLTPWGTAGVAILACLVGWSLVHFVCYIFDDRKNISKKKNTRSYKVIN